ncbi:glycoside hydrolase family 18 protein [Sutcliffiella horikoshii]|uniref:chitinase n=1 Tax=Sutcliffiella horikoshii TaxID=79883 RepID=A0AA95B514_9BACI|nr:glycosyl hydrolase family 18 protein [Sutcliffiella horikoshii]TYS57577.1 glycoside hydrolase family 18 protein [Sutcliffiella horikoshii]
MQLRWKLTIFLLALLVIGGTITIYLINSTKPVSNLNTEKKPEVVEELTDNPPEIINFTYNSSDEEEDSLVSGDVELQLEAKDDNSIRKVEFYSSNGDYLIGEKTEAPYTINWSTDPWVENGEQILKVVVYDTAGQKAEATKKVTVENKLEPEADYKMIGYYAGWSSYSGYNVSRIDASKLTHINYAFANISEDGEIIVGDPASDYENFKQMLQLKKRHPHLKTMISVGGWTWSKTFSDAAASEDSRTKFAESVRRFILENGFDGVDLDWEYPVSGGHPDNVNRPEDKRNYTLLLKKIRETLKEQEKKDGKDYLLTIAAGASKSHAANMELSELHQYVDYIQLMTYDINGEWDELTGLNAPLYKDPNSAFSWQWSVKDGIETYIASGVPSDKLVMGMPFYGRVFHEAKANNNGLYQAFNGGTSLSYGKLAEEYIEKNGFERHWMEKTQVPVLYNGETFISYDDEKSIAKKTDFLKRNDLGGAMMWELSQDPDRVLLNQIYKELNK